jgi:hypothetical protein
MSLKQISIIGLLLASMLSLTACAPEVGSEAWCNAMKEKPKGDWSADEAGDFAQHCLLN